MAGPSFDGSDMFANMATMSRMVPTMPHAGAQSP